MVFGSSGFAGPPLPFWPGPPPIPAPLPTALDASLTWPSAVPPRRTRSVAPKVTPIATTTTPDRNNLADMRASPCQEPAAQAQREGRDTPVIVAQPASPWQAQSLAAQGCYNRGADDEPRRMTIPEDGVNIR